MKGKMRITRGAAFCAVLLIGIVAGAQEFPRSEVAFNYSYTRYSPSAPYSKGHSLSGGGGSITFNLNSVFGIEANLQGYGSNHTGFNIAPNATFPNGLNGDVQGNLFTYLFGPQIKIRAHHIHPYAHLLFGGAHSNVYADAFKTFCGPGSTVCGIRTAPAQDAFAMEFGGGIDIPINHIVTFRPAEINYLLTRFSNVFTGTNNQNNVHYAVGVVFNLGNTTY